MFKRKDLLSSARRSVVAAVIAGLAVRLPEPPMATAASMGPARRQRPFRRLRRAAAPPMSARAAGTIVAARMPPALRSWDDDRNNWGGDRCPAAARLRLLRLLRAAARLIWPAAYGYGPYYGRRFYRYYPY